MSILAEIFQFKILLRGFQAPIWRRIQVKVEDFTFFDLHVAIQNAMGWIGGHNHRFFMKHPNSNSRDCIGLCKHIYPYARFLETEQLVDEYFTETNRSCSYKYDLVDGWNHLIYLEKIIYADAFQKYPRCIAGKRACPLENSGGPWSYQQFLKKIFDPTHPEFFMCMDQLKRSFYGEEFDPEHFDANEIVFENAVDTWMDELEWEIGCKCLAEES